MKICGGQRPARIPDRRGHEGRHVEQILADLAQFLIEDRTHGDNSSVHG
ncbi:hypothetical protein [Sanguibacter sp. Z1732]